MCNNKNKHFLTTQKHTELSLKTLNFMSDGEVNTHSQRNNDRDLHSRKISPLVIKWEQIEVTAGHLLNFVRNIKSFH